MPFHVAFHPTRLGRLTGCQAASQAEHPATELRARRFHALERFVEFQ